jgi:NAD(P)H-flavin reductase
MSLSTTTAALDPLLAPSVHRVLEVIDEIPDVVTLRVAPVDGVPAAFRPGQVDMVGAFGVGEAAISISSAMEQTTFHDYTIRRVGAITSALTALGAGDPLWVRGPFGRPWDLALDGNDVVVAAGGIGIAPLRSAVLELVRYRERYGQVVVVVGARDAAHLLFAREYDGWREHGLTVVDTIDRPEDGWDRRVGFVADVVAEVVAEQGLDPRRTAALLCGPDIMMRLTADRLIVSGVAADAVQLTVERNMQCGNGLCGHCQMGGVIACRDGPIVRYPAVADALRIPEW